MNLDMIWAVKRKLEVVSSVVFTDVVARLVEMPTSMKHVAGSILGQAA